MGAKQHKAGLRRAASFESFTRRYVPETSKLYIKENQINASKTIFVLGSDQIWNYKFNLTKEDIELRLGEFAPENCLLTYAASIGLNSIEEKWASVFKKGWSRIPRISVREDRAAELVREVSGRDAAVVLDPTLLLTPAQWSEVFTDFVSEGDRYVLTYFLGSPTESQEGVIRERARSLGARVRRLNDPRDRETYAAGPAEFVELISRAEYVFTDSYHACCFSALFNRPFKVFNRSGLGDGASMNSRMRTLFRLLGLEDLMGDDSALAEFDWGRVNSLLERRRAESLSWLESALADAAAGVAD